MENDKEHAAMGAVIQAFSDLDQDGRLRVLEYIAKRFGINISSASVASLAVPAAKKLVSEPVSPVYEASAIEAATSRARDIRELKSEKSPRNDSQMAVLVAYYLKTMVPEEEKKDAIKASDIEYYFTQADYPLPSGKNGAADTLGNAKRAGYMESAGHGLYRLNRVGFNLAAYNMPTEATTPARKPIRRTRKVAKPAKKRK